MRNKWFWGLPLIRDSTKNTLNTSPKQSSYPPEADIHKILWIRAAHDSANFVEKHLSETLLFPSKQQIREFALREISSEGLLIEFGVFGGESINFLASILSANGDSRKIFGFDSFTGLEQDWHGHEVMRKENFNRGGSVPIVAENVTLVAGRIEDTLPPFLSARTDRIAFIHLDTDTYQPAKFILEKCRPFVMAGTIILFDEYLGYPNWRNHEHKAFVEVFGEEGGFTYRAFSTHGAVIEIR